MRLQDMQDHIKNKYIDFIKNNKEYIANQDFIGLYKAVVKQDEIYSGFETSISNLFQILEDSAIDVIEGMAPKILPFTFYNRDDLTTRYIPGEIKIIDDSAFEHCKNLQSVELGDGVRQIKNNVFSSCVSLTSVTLPDTLTSIGDGAFSDCINLTSITLPDSISHIGVGAFRNCNREFKVICSEYIADVLKENNPRVKTKIN